MSEEKVYVRHVIEHSPAALSKKIGRGDIIFSIDHYCVVGLTLNEVERRMLGGEGTKVILTIIRDDEMTELVLQRGIVPQELPLKAKVKHIIITSFFSKFLAWEKDAICEYGCIYLRKHNRGSKLPSVKDFTKMDLSEYKLLLPVPNVPSMLEPCFGLEHVCGKGQVHILSFKSPAVMSIWATVVVQYCALGQQQKDTVLGVNGSPERKEDKENNESIVCTAAVGWAELNEEGFSSAINTSLNLRSVRLLDSIKQKI